MVHKAAAAEPALAKPKLMTLPTLIMTASDVGRLEHELERVDDALLQLKIRSGGEEQAKLPKTSRLLDLVAEENHLNLLNNDHRLLLKQFLETVDKKAPRLHFSFSADPSAKFLDKLTAWIRKEIAPYALVTVGLQPNLGAGCILRTTNKQFDFSLKQTFIDHQDLLLKGLQSYADEPVAETVPPDQAPVAQPAVAPVATGQAA